MVKPVQLSGVLSSTHVHRSITSYHELVTIKPHKPSRTNHFHYSNSQKWYVGVSKYISKIIKMIQHVSIYIYIYVHLER